MAGRNAHYHKADLLSPRQREVLERIARGMTNAQIADDLGIGFESVKSHVSEILLKLHVDSREQAVEAWRAQRHPLQRMRDFARGTLATGWLKLAAGAGIVVAGGTIAALIALSTGDDAPPASPTEVPTAGVTASASPTTAVTNPAPVSLQLAPMGAALPLGESVVYMEGYPGKGGGLNLHRRTQTASDVISVTEIRPPVLDEPDTWPRHAWVSADTQTILYVTCAGLCTLETDPPPERDAQLWRSVDGGVTWEFVSDVPGGSTVWGEMSDGRAMVAGSSPEDVRLYPDGELAPRPLQTSGLGWEPTVHPTLGPAWMQETSSPDLGASLRVFDFNGQRLPYRSAPGDTRNYTFATFTSQGDAVWLATEADVTVLQLDAPSSRTHTTVTWPGLLTHFVPLSDGRVMAMGRSELLRPYLDLSFPANEPAAIPVIIDFAKGTVEVAWPLAPRIVANGQAAMFYFPVAASY